MLTPKNNEFASIVIYYDTKAFPKKYLARAEYTTYKTTKVRFDKNVWVFDHYGSWEPLFKVFGLLRVGRRDDDDKTITERWL